MNLLALLLRGAGITVPWWGRWLAIGALVAAWSGWIALKVHAHDERELDAYKAEVKAAGDRQNAMTQQIILAHRHLKEIADAEARTAAVERDAAALRLRDIQRAIAGVSLLPAPAPNTTGGNNICFAADELDRGLRNALAGVANRLGPIAQEGQRGVDTAVVCRDWARGLGAP